MSKVKWLEEENDEYRERIKSITGEVMSNEDASKVAALSVKIHSNEVKIANIKRGRPELGYSLLPVVGKKRGETAEKD